MAAAHVFAGFLVTLGGFVCLSNWAYLLLAFITKRFYSTVPLIGALLLGTGMAGFRSSRPYALSALILDYGTIALLLATPRIIGEIWSTSRVNLVREYCGQSGMKTVYIRLFRGGVFTIRLQLRRPRHPGIVGRGSIGTWQDDGGDLTLVAGAESACFKVIQDVQVQALRQSFGFETWESHDESSLSKIDFVQTAPKRRIA